MKNDILNKYLTYLENEKSLSKASIDAYKNDIMHFSAYLKSQKTDITNAKRKHILSYIVFMQKSGKADSSVSRAVASVKSLYSFMVIKGYTDTNPASDIKTPTPLKKVPEYLSMEDTEVLLNTPDTDTLRGMRDKAILEIMYATGLKATELLKLKLKDIDTELGYIRCSAGSNIRIVPLGKEAVNAADTYIKYSRPELADSESKMLFVNCRGENLTRQGLWKIIKEYAKKANIQSDITPHTLRHSFAMHMLQNGADLITIQEMLGHKDASTTQMYAGIFRSHIREVYNNTHPRA